MQSADISQSLISELKDSNNAHELQQAKEISFTVGGFVPFTTVDYPEHLAAVIFSQGCPFRCHYCHNPGLLDRTKKTNYQWPAIIDFLRCRQGLLEAVVFSGGEPTLQQDLYKAMLVVKNIGYKIGLHTAGPYPQQIKKILPLLDWVGVDVKAPFAKYASVTMVPSGEKALTSIQILLANNIACEFRTTIHPKLLTEEQIFTIATSLRSLGVTNYTLQRFRAVGCQNQELCQHSMHDFPSRKLQVKLSKWFARFKVV